MSGTNPKTKLTFAKVAASAAARPPPTAANAATIPNGHASPKIDQGKDVQLRNGDEDVKGGQPSIDIDKFTPRPAKSVPVRLRDVEPVQDPSALLPRRIVNEDIKPVSEENVTRLQLVRGEQSSLSFDGKSTTSGTTFPLDEKESLRPDDSASLKAQDDDDGPNSTQPSSRMGSDTGARAFSEQLREISIMGPPSTRQPALIRPNFNNAQANGTLYEPSPIAVPHALNAVSATLGQEPCAQPCAPDEKLLEALTSVRDRVWVLKLEQDITDFVKDATAQFFDLPNCNSFYRMLAHKMADYYLLGHTMNESQSGLRLYKTPNCRIPPRLSEVTNPSTAASTPPPILPQMKILRRDDNDTRSGSRGPDDGSDVGKGRFPATREEREARYEAARLRILGSAKPSDDAVASQPKEGESKSNSVVGRSKKSKQRKSNEDGFEARSAYSTFPNGTVGPFMPPSEQNGLLDHTGQMYPPEMSHGMPLPYPAIYDQSQQNFNGQYWTPQMPVQGFQTSQGWIQAPYYPYDVTTQMQQMSFQPPIGPTAYPISPGSSMSYDSPQQHHSTPNYAVPHGYAFQPHVNSTTQGYTVPQPYYFGYSGTSSANSQNPGMSTQQDQQYFNPNSQAFVPGYGYSVPNGQGPQHMTSLAPMNAASMPSQAGPQAAQPGPKYQWPQHASQTPQALPSFQQHSGQASVNHAKQSVPRPTSQAQFHGQSTEKHRAKPIPKSEPQKSSIAKFSTGVTLPAKPPPPLADHVKPLATPEKIDDIGKGTSVT